MAYKGNEEAFVDLLVYVSVRDDDLIAALDDGLARSFEFK